MVKVTATLQKWGNSQGLRIPKSVLEAAEIGENDKVVIIAENNEIRISKSEHFDTLDDLFKNYHGDYKCEELDTGLPIGNEV
jgi:antitoxin MazE